MSFKFKQFEMRHSNSTMKIGTDAVLLGSWFNDSHATNILDIGTGSGVIALIAAQRTTAFIDAIDIHKDSITEAEKNFKTSRWSDRLSAHLVSLQEYSTLSKKKYNHILSNPPFFVNALKSPDTKRNLARHTDNLSFEDFITFSKNISYPNALLSIILPAKEGVLFRSIAAKHGYFLSRITNIFPTETKKVNRVLMEFILSEEPLSLLINDLYIRKNNNRYSDEYKILTKDFYLNF